MKTTLISTVGISLYNKLKYLKEPLLELTPSEIAQNLRETNRGKWACAEIASITSILDNKILEKEEELWLLASETEEGFVSGEIIKAYYESIFESVKLIVIPGLNTVDMNVFRDEGLRHLVKTTSQIIYSAKNRNQECVINATGGYKAQISFVSLIGEVLKIPVYYQFEDFESIIKLPSMPITLDYQLWLMHFATFDKLYRFGSLPAHQMNQAILQDEEIKELLDEASGQYRLSSVGLLMHEVLLQRFTKDGDLYLPEIIEGKRQIEERRIFQFPETIPLSLVTLLDTIINLNYVKEITFLRVKEDFKGRTYFNRVAEQPGLIEGSFYDGRHTWFFTLVTSSTEAAKDYAAVVDLNLRFGNPFEKPKPGHVEFLLIRHGQHTGENDNRVEGWADFELTETGRKQASLLAERLKCEYKIDALYTSSLLRAKQTAGIVGDVLGMEVTPLDDLKAMNYGLSSGLRKYEASVLFPKTRDSQFLNNKSWGRETEIEFSKRVLESFYDLYYAHPGETIAIVTHGRAISTILREALKLPISHDFRVGADDTSIHHIVMGPDKTEIQILNNSEHLKQLSSAGETFEQA